MLFASEGIAIFGFHKADLRSCVGLLLEDFRVKVQVLAYQKISAFGDC